MNESLWIDAAKKGDSVCLTALIEANYQLVYRYLYRMSFDQMLSEDLTQETFTRFIQHLEKYTPTAKLSTYLITIAANLLKDVYKKNKTQSDFLSKLNFTPVIDHPTTHLELEEALMRLDLEARSVLLLHEYYGFSLLEISNMLKIPLGTIKSKRHYAIKKLKEGGLYE